ncbi:MAG: site-specific integrase [Bacteroidales bacterium]|nr:site-specific integrase [Bacteroidales bacterium]MCF8458607.1 site-specific integrase [Bacteroidales bacterium]
MKYNIKIALEQRKDKSGEIKTEKVPILVHITFSGDRELYFTGFRIDVDKFDPIKQEATKNSTGWEGTKKVQYNIINNRLKAIKATLELFFQDVNVATKKQVRAQLDEVCKKWKKPDIKPEDMEFFQMWDKYIKDANVVENRRRHLKSTRNLWLKFQERKKIIFTFELVDSDLLLEFEHFLKNDDKPKGRNTIRSKMSMTRTFWNYARRKLKEYGKLIHDPFGEDGYKIPGEIYGDPIYITIEERNILFNAPLTSEKLSRVRDIFVFQCLIGTRVGDLSKLTKNNIHNGMLSYIQGKTKEGQPKTVTVPLHPHALEILNRYDIPDGKLLPFISDQKYNDYLKDLFLEIGLTRMVTRINPTTGEPEQVKLNDIVSSHMGRRAFIGNLYGKVDTGIISSMSGHTPGSRAFSRYYDVSKELQQDAISKL